MAITRWLKSLYWYVQGDIKLHFICLIFIQEYFKAKEEPYTSYMHFSTQQLQQKLDEYIVDNCLDDNNEGDLQLKLHYRANKQRLATSR